MPANISMAKKVLPVMETVPPRTCLRRADACEMAVSAVYRYLMPSEPILEPRPADRCTFHRPFAPGFSECPTFEAVEYGLTDFAGNPMGAIISCTHLEPHLLSKGGSSYPRCQLGGPAERAAYAAGNQ